MRLDGSLAQEGAPKFDFAYGRRILPVRVGRAVAAEALLRWRKVRAPADRVPGNAWGARAYGKCNREQTAEVPDGTGKGETVR